MEFSQNHKRFCEEVNIVAVLRVVFENLHDVFDLLVGLLLVQRFICDLLSHNLGWICEDQEKGQSTLILNGLEKGAKLSVFIDLVLKSEAVSISREDIELFILPIIEKLEKLNKLLTSILILGFLKSENGMISCQAIGYTPNSIDIPEITFLNSFQIFIFDVSSELVNHLVDYF